MVPSSNFCQLAVGLIPTTLSAPLKSTSMFSLHVVSLAFPNSFRAIASGAGFSRVDRKRSPYQTATGPMSRAMLGLKHGRCGMSETFDFSAYLDDEIARNERVLKSARRAASVPAPNEFDSSEIVALIERHLDDLKRIRAQQGRRHAPRP